jgi:hypothetical protein
VVDHRKRLDLAAPADLALAFYNPISRARPWQLGRAGDRRAASHAATPVVLGATSVARADLRVTTLGQLTPDQVDMRTMVLIGSSTTCTFPVPKVAVGVHAALVRRKAAGMSAGEGACSLAMPDMAGRFPDLPMSYLSAVRVRFAPLPRGLFLMTYILSDLS